MSKQPAELLQGTLDMLILSTLALAPLHGVGIARRIEQVTQGTFLVKPGSLFPALHRMDPPFKLRLHVRRCRAVGRTARGNGRLGTVTVQHLRIACNVRPSGHFVCDHALGSGQSA